MALLFPTLDSEALRELPFEMFRASVLAMDEADYLVIPQIRHIQVRSGW